MRVSHFSLAGTLFVGALLLSTPSLAEDQTDFAGQLLYVHYCSSCHGLGGKGDGTLREILREKPTDLTGIAKGSGGNFPYAEVLRAIDGRKSVRAHGSSDMPVWGQVFLEDPDASLSEQLAGAGKLFLIVQYLESLQSK